MFNRQLKKNINELDVRISELGKEMDQAQSDDEWKKLLNEVKDLADLRDKLSESKTRESLSQYVIPGVIGLAATFMIIRHEETNVISSKAMSLATRLFRG